MVEQGFTGGEKAAKLLNGAVFDYLRLDEEFEQDHKIIVRIYANIEELRKKYISSGIWPNAAAFGDFVLGFNNAHPLFDFLDVGNQREAADSKLKGAQGIQRHDTGTVADSHSRKPYPISTQCPMQKDHHWHVSG